MQSGVSLSIWNPFKGVTTTHPLVAAYRRKKVTRLLLAEGDPHFPIHIVYTLSPQGVFWAGGLTLTAKQALLRTPEGDRWMWRNAMYRRLTIDEIHQIMPPQPVTLLGTEPF